MGLIALITSTGNTNSTRLRLVQFHALPVPVTCAINPHIALSTVLLTILFICVYMYTCTGMYVYTHTLYKLLMPCGAVQLWQYVYNILSP